MPATITVYPARVVHTMEPAVPSAPAVAVRDGRILGVGTVDELVGWGEATVDATFADHVLVPGFVEAHSHSLAGALARFPYVGFFDCPAPDGTVWAGCPSIGAVLDRLRDLDASMGDPDELLVAWGLDPIYFPGERLVAAHLDRVSTRRPIFVFHASNHLATVNSALMAAEDITADTLVEGVVKDADGEPVGELQEFAAMGLARTAFGHIVRAMGDARSVQDFGRLARNAGVTTLTELGSVGLSRPGVVDTWREVVEHPDFPARVSMFANPGLSGLGPDAATELAVELAATSTDKLRFGHVKLILDGSIQGFTARLRWPGYHGGQPNGIWIVPPEQVVDHVLAPHRAGLTVHAHCNGDEAADVFIDAVEAALEAHPRWDHRHTVQHCQLTTPGQYRRMAALGMCANVFSNHLFYWGDQHRTLTVGPDRAARMNACATASASGVPFSMHSDAAVTPLGPLHVAWCAVNRRTASGVVMGEHERIGVADALRAITLGSAYQLKMDDEIGSVAPGKRADFTVLEADPLAVDPAELKDVPVWGTVLDGVPRPAGA